MVDIRFASRGVLNSFIHADLAQLEPVSFDARRPLCAEGKLVFASQRYDGGLVQSG